MTDVLRRREDDHLARDRRGARHGAVAARRADAAGRDAAAGARFARWPRSTPSSSPGGSRPSPFAAKYGATIDRDSAYERINAKIAASRAAAAQAATDAAVRAGVDPTTATGLNTMTPAQQRAEINRQAREIAAAQKQAERERKAQEKAAADARKAQQRTIDTALRTGGKVVTSRLGQDVDPGRLRDALRRRQALIRAA